MLRKFFDKFTIRFLSFGRITGKRNRPKESIYEFTDDFFVI